MSMPPQGFGSQTGMLPIQPQYNQMHQQQTPPQQHVYATQSSYGSNQVCEFNVLNVYHVHFIPNIFAEHVPIQSTDIRVV